TLIRLIKGWARSGGRREEDIFDLSPVTNPPWPWQDEGQLALRFREFVPQPDAETRQRLMWNARLYDDKHSFVWKQASDLVELLPPQRGDRIPDTGCGTGHLTTKLAEAGAWVVGIDLPSEMIAEARRNYPGLAFDVADARELPYENRFDAVFSNAVLHW